MRRTAHYTLGMASALAIIQPSSFSEVICVSVGGILGGKIVDIDLNNHNGYQDEEKETAVSIYSWALVAICFALDYLVGNGMCDYFINNLDYISIGAFALFALLSVVGYFSAHRSFMHSILAMAIFTALMWFAIRPLAIPFGIGYASHILIDLTNKTGLMLFFPIKKRLCSKWCSSNGTVNGLMSIWGRCLSGCLFGWFAIRTLVSTGDGSYILNMLRSEYQESNVFAIYFVLVNIITGALFYAVYNYSKKRYIETHEKSFESNLIFLLNIFLILGGAVGMFLSLLISRQRLAKYNAIWYLLVFSYMEVWAVISLVVNWYNLPIPFEISIEHVCIYLILINVACAIAFIADRNSFNTEWSGLETIKLIFGVLGGCYCGLLIASFIDMRNNIAFTRGFTYLCVSHFALFTYMVSVGIICI